MPYRTPVGVTYDSGEYDANLQKAMDLADWNGFEARTAESASRGYLRGRGVANYIQVASGVPFEWGALRVRPDGVVEIYSGTHNHGQGHETVFAQLIVDRLGVPFESVRLIMGDTDRIPRGQGTHGSRSMMLAGPLIAVNSDKIIDKARRIAAFRLEAAEGDITFLEGTLTVAGTDLSLDLFEVAAIAESDETLPDELRGPLAAESDYTTPDATYPSGTHICEVEVDAETGLVRLDRFTAIDDVGRAINPMILFGQSHGGIAQGVGQALLEDCRYDGETGQLLSGSFMDYCLPRADDLPSIAVGLNEALSPVNVLGVKGAGESGATGAPPAVINAIVDALGECGVTHIDMPATPERVWRAIRAADRQGH
jgi:carbon-monoxide dehydrogenase large subunit